MECKASLALKINDLACRAQSTMNTLEIYKRLKIGSSLMVGLIVGKWAANWNLSDYSALFSAGFLAGAVGTQGAFRLFDLWRRKRTPQESS